MREIKADIPEIADRLTIFLMFVNAPTTEYMLLRGIA